MRDNKFRVWDHIKNTMWQPENVANFDFESKCIWIKQKYQGGHWINFKHSSVLDYTGLEDDNENEIFLGDIVKLTYGEYPSVSTFNGGHDVIDSWTKEEILAVEFVRGSFMIGKHLMWALEEMPFDYSLKVIGNIYQDQELLSQN